MDGKTRLAEVARRLREENRDLKQRFFAEVGDRASMFSGRVREKREAILSTISAETAGSFDVAPIFEATNAFCARSDWSLIDVANLAAVCPSIDEDLIQECAGATLLYHGARIVDDVIDGHRSYKDLYSTLPTELIPVVGDESDAVSVSLLSALFLFFASFPKVSPSLIDLSRKSIIGNLMEKVRTAPVDRPHYDRLVELKTVAYSQLLYDPILVRFPEGSGLHEFVLQTFRVSQYLNDLHDLGDDRDREQPNLVVLLEREGRGTGEIDGFLANSLLDCAERSEALPSTVQGYAYCRLFDLGSYVEQLLIPQKNDSERVGGSASPGP